MAKSYSAFVIKVICEHSAITYCRHTYNKLQIMLWGACLLSTLFDVFIHRCSHRKRSRDQGTEWESRDQDSSLSSTNDPLCDLGQVTPPVSMLLLPRPAMPCQFIVSSSVQKLFYTVFTPSTMGSQSIIVNTNKYILSFELPLKFNPHDKFQL